MIRRCVFLAALATGRLAQPQVTSEATEVDFDFGFEEEGSADAERGHLSLPIRGAFALEAEHSAGTNPRWHKAGPEASFVVDWNGGFGQIFGEATLRFNRAYRWEDDPESVVSARELEGVARELYWKKSFGRWSLMAGNTIVAWGEGDVLTPSDVVSRRDASRFLFENPATNRLGQNLVQLSFYPHASDQIDILAVPTALSDRLAPAGHPDAFSESVPVRDADGGMQPELGARWRHRFAEGELALHGGYFHDRRGVMAPEGSFLERSSLGNAFFGASGHRALGPVLWRGEIGFHHDRASQRWSEGLPAGYEKQDVVFGLIAADVSSSRWGRVSLELGLSSAPEFAADVVDQGVHANVAVTWMRGFLRDTLFAQTTVLSQDSWNNLLARAELRYRFRDEWEVRGQLTAINGGSVWGPFASHARVGIDVRYSFDLGNASP